MTGMNSTHSAGRSDYASYAVGFSLWVVLSAGPLPPGSVLAAETHPSLNPQYDNKCKADWLYRGQYGVATSYFAPNPQAQEGIIRAFDARKIAQQTAEAGAAWFLLTLHQMSWVMNGPNETLDRLLGTGEYTAERDLPLELSEELKPKGIRMLLYLNLRMDPDSPCPETVRQAMGGWPPNDKLITNIASVYREFSLRYGKRVSGWWIDSAGMRAYAGAPHRDLWFKTIAVALRAGNPEALISFNPGVRISRYSREDDYTAGESEDLRQQPNGRRQDGIQWHAWTYLGGWWPSDGTRFTDEALGNYITRATGPGGALTFNLGSLGIIKSGIHEKPEYHRQPGTLDSAQVEQLGRAIRYRRNPSLDSSECPVH